MTDSKIPNHNAGNGKSGLNDNDKTKTQQISKSSSSLLSHHPKQIGKYRLKRLIASGGMGMVFEAVQENPRRTVAIKVIKGSDVSESAVSRLKYEAQMLARLRHPGIAEIYEAGTYEENGKEIPFFAMEYIPNAKSITEYANTRKLTVDQRLEMFAQVCDAVNSGHQRGIVHRDLKPDNILVDSHNRIKIIDFGLARATDSDLRQTNAQTEVGQIIGSLQYMSPEQFEGDSHDLDTRSDVYSLGVVLYELLSGSLPYNLSAKKIFEIANIVRETQPLPLGKSGTKVAVEIDIILQKALRKDREDRYQTAHGLAQDIGRYLAGDAIVARSPSLTYQVKIFARKNKLLVGSFATAFVALIAGVVISTTLFIQVSAEKKRVELEAKKTEKAHDFLTKTFDSAIPKGYGDQVSISRLIDKSNKMLEGAFPDDPETEADIRHSLGRGYFRMGKYKEAKENINYAFLLRKEVLGELHPKTKSSLEELNLLYKISGDFENYLGNCREICRIDSLSYGPSDENTIGSQISVIGALEKNGNIAEALKLALETRKQYLSEFPENLKLEVTINGYVAWLLLQSGSFEKAEKMARETFAIATAKIEDGSYTEDSKSVLAAALISQGKLEEATGLYGNFPTYPELDKEYDIRGSFDPDSSDVHFIIFWEEWCPWCDKMMSRTEDLYRQYHNYGIDMVGVTRLDGKSTREDSEQFLKRHDISFPIIKEGGKAFKHFNGAGFPSMRLVYKGKLIWDNRVPSMAPISRHMLEGIVKARQSLK